MEKLSNGINCCNNRNDAIYRNYSFNIVAYNIMKEEFYGQECTKHLLSRSEEMQALPQMHSIFE